MKVTSKRILKVLGVFAGIAISICVVVLIAASIYLSYFFPEISAPDAKAVYAINQKAGTAITVADLLTDKNVTRVCVIPVGDRISEIVGAAATRKLNLNTESDEAHWVIYLERNGVGKIEIVRSGEVGIKLHDGFCTSKLDEKILLAPCQECTKGFLLSFGK